MDRTIHAFVGLGRRASTLSLIDEPLSARREVMLKTIDRAGHQQLIASDGVVGPGTSFYDHVVRQQRPERVASAQVAPAAAACSTIVETCPRLRRQPVLPGRVFSHDGRA